MANKSTTFKIKGITIDLSLEKARKNAELLFSLTGERNAGKAGEMLIKKLCFGADFTCSAHGVADLISNGVTYEIKVMNNNRPANFIAYDKIEDFLSVDKKQVYLFFIDCKIFSIKECNLKKILRSELLELQADKQAKKFGTFIKARKNKGSNDINSLALKVTKKSLQAYASSLTYQPNLTNRLGLS